MSSQFDVFDNLNEYLNKNDDVDFPDEELGDFDDQEPDPDEIPPPIKQKRGAKKKTTEDLDPIPPKRPKRRVAAPVNIDSSGDEDDLLSGPSTSSSHSSLQSQPPQPKQQTVDLAGDDLDEQFNEVQKQYDLIFHHSPLIQENASYFSSLQKRFQTLLKQKRSPRGRNKAFMTNFESLKEIFYNICINRNLMAPNTSFLTAAGPSSSAAPTGRRRRQQEPELINLVDSPALILPGTINLDSDEEVPPSDKNANVSFDSENYEVSLKIKWGSKIERFAHRKFQKFADLIAVLAERYGADPDHVVLNLEDRIIEPDDTPDSIGYSICHFISGRVVQGKVAEMFSKKETNGAGTAKQKKKPMDANVINLKVQSDRWKKPLEVQIGKHQKLMIVVIKCAEELKCKPGDIKLSFDGDPLPMDSTPTDLELDGGEVLDLRFLKG